MKTNFLNKNELYVKFKVENNILVRVLSKEINFFFWKMKVGWLSVYKERDKS